MAKYIKATECAEIISKEFNISLYGLVDVFAGVPTADVVEVRHGKWIIKNNELHWQDKDHYSLFITCSECGLTHFLGTTRYANEYNEQKFKDNNYDKYLFCGKCGAKMDKE